MFLLCFLLRSQKKKKEIMPAKAASSTSKAVARPSLLEGSSEEIADWYMKQYEDRLDAVLKQLTEAKAGGSSSSSPAAGPGPAATAAGRFERPALRSTAPQTSTTTSGTT